MSLKFKRGTLAGCYSWSSVCGSELLVPGGRIVALAVFPDLPRGV